MGNSIQRPEFPELILLAVTLVDLYPRIYLRGIWYIESSLRVQEGNEQDPRTAVWAIDIPPLRLARRRSRQLDECLAVTFGDFDGLVRFSIDDLEYRWGVANGLQNPVLGSFASKLRHLGNKLPGRSRDPGRQHLAAGFTFNHDRYVEWSPFNRLRFVRNDEHAECRHENSSVHVYLPFQLCTLKDRSMVRSKRHRQRGVECFVRRRSR